MTKIQSWKPDSDGSWSASVLIEILESQGYGCTIYCYTPGTLFPEHEHDTDKIDAVIRGRFRLSMAGETIILNPGEYISIPARTRHTAEVAGNEPVIAIDAVKLD